VARLVDPESGFVCLGDYKLWGGMSAEELHDPRGHESGIGARDIRTEFGFVHWQPSFQKNALRQVRLTFSNPDYVDEVPADATLALTVSHALKGDLGLPKTRVKAASPFDWFWFGSRRPRGLRELESMGWSFGWGSVEFAFDPRDLSPRVVVKWIN
jgi:hypothetical protein